MKDISSPVLYILMRTDMDSMCPGRGMAQASHATSAAAKRLSGSGNVLYDLWGKSTDQGFGTVIVLGASEFEMDSIISLAHDLPMAFAEIITDPTYPLSDGDSLHLISVNTCAYIFCDRHNARIRTLLSDLALHP